MRLGIDFGTTRTVVAVCDRGNYPVLCFHGPDGEALDGFPTVVAERDGELRYGLDALAAGPDFTVVRSFKRVLGEPGGPDRMVTIGATKIALFDLLVGFLDALRVAIRERSNLPRAKRKDDELRTVVATPAHAHGTQRFLTLEAFRRAGFDVVATLNEPSAAGFEYTHAHRNTVTSKREHVVVYDLGGGTFDASLVRVTDLRHDAVVTAGVARLGGDDFDEVLLDLALREASIAPKDARTRDRFLDRCREAKERLNPNSRKVVVELDDRTVTLAASDYYAACLPLVDQSIAAMMPVIERASEGERDDPLADVAGIYVVGGASALPVVGRALRERFGRRVHRSPYPAAATAVGLAIAADDDAGFEISDRFSRTFGVFREAREGSDVAFDVVFDRETMLPKQGAPPLRVERRYQVAHDVGHFRFVECSAVDRAGAPQGDLSLFADVRFPFVPELQRDGVDLARAEVRRLGGLGTIVREVYELDPHGLVRLSIVDERTGFSRAFALSR